MSLTSLSTPNRTGTSGVSRRTRTGSWFPRTRTSSTSRIALMTRDDCSGCEWAIAEPPLCSSDSNRPGQASRIHSQRVTASFSSAEFHRGRHGATSILPHTTASTASLNEQSVAAPLGCPRTRTQPVGRYSSSSMVIRESCPRRRLSDRVRVRVRSPSANANGVVPPSPGLAEARGLPGVRSTRPIPPQRGCGLPQLRPAPSAVLIPSFMATPPPSTPSAHKRGLRAVQSASCTPSNRAGR